MNRITALQFVLSDPHSSQQDRDAAICVLTDIATNAAGDERRAARSVLQNSGLSVESIVDDELDADLALLLSEERKLDKRDVSPLARRCWQDMICDLFGFPQSFPFADAFERMTKLCRHGQFPVVRERALMTLRGISRESWAPAEVREAAQRFLAAQEVEVASDQPTTNPGCGNTPSVLADHGLVAGNDVAESIVSVDPL